MTSGRTMALRRILLCLALAALAGAMFALGPSLLTVPPEAVAIRAATLSGEAGERQVSLPDRLRRDDFPAAGGTVRYRLALELDRPPPAPLAIFVPRVSLAAQVSVNGNDVGACAVGPLHRLRCLHQPQLIVPPAAVWRAGANEIEFLVHADSHQSNGLSRVIVGPRDAIARGPFAWSHGLRVALIHMLTWVGIALSLISLSIAFVLRDEPVYLWLGVAALTSAVSNVNILVTAPVLSVQVFGWIVFASRLASAPAVLLALLAFFDRGPRALRVTLVTWIVAAPVAVALSGNDLGVVAALYVPLLGLCVVLGVAAIGWIRERQRRTDIAMVATFELLVAASLHDWARLALGVQFEGVYLLPYASVGVLAVMGGLVVRRLAVALTTARTLAADLERRVAQREAQLQERFEQLRTLEQARVRLEERERLLRDMHDGIGSQLASARLQLSAGTMSGGRAAGVLQECLDDLRLLLDVAGSPYVELRGALADLRARLDRRLAAGPVKLAWDVDLQGMPALAERDLLQLMRIVQEAIANALRHADASRIDVAARWRPEASMLELDVRDDGRGLPPAGSAPGSRGLLNMRRRARELGAELDVGGNGPGCAVRVRMPRRAAPC